MPIFIDTMLTKNVVIQWWVIGLLWNWDVGTEESDIRMIGFIDDLFNML